MILDIFICIVLYQEQNLSKYSGKIERLGKAK